MALDLITHPAEEPVSLVEAKRDMRLDDAFTEHDLLIEGLITAARERYENICNRAFIRQQWQIVEWRFPAARKTILLPLSPLISVDKIAYQDTAGDWHELEEDDYQVDMSEPPKIFPVHSWPVTHHAPDAVSITFTAGYGSAIDVPESIKNAIRLYCKAHYESAFNDGASREYERRMAAADALISTYRVFQFR